MSSRIPHIIAAAWARSVRSGEAPPLPREELQEAEKAPGASAEALARWQMAAPAWLLVEEDPPAFPHLARRLRPLFLAARGRTLAALQALKEAADALAEEGIELLVTQGAALLGSVPLPHPDLRSMVDADVLVRPHQRERALQILRGAGFRSLDGVGRFGRGSGILDVHVRPLGMERIHSRRLALPMDTGELWEESAPIPPRTPLPGSALPGGVRVPSLPCQWVLTLAHAQKHSFSSLKWPLDLVILAEAMGEGGRGRAAAHARRLGLQGTWTVLGEIAGAWGAPLPPELEPPRQALSRPQGRLAREAVQRVREGEETGWIGERMLWAMAPGPWERALLVWETLFPGRETMRSLYPSYRPLLRPLFLLRRLWDVGRQLFGSR